LEVFRETGKAYHSGPEKMRLTNGCTGQIFAVTFFSWQKSRHQKFAR